MQTFLPDADLEVSVQCLDPKRLGNQVYREGMTLLRGGWPNHPASKMWRGYEQALREYLIHGVYELRRRGSDYRERPWCIELMEGYDPDNVVMPPWLGDERVHSSHRSCLLWKAPDWYQQFGWDDPVGAPVDGVLPYYWPI